MFLQMLIGDGIVLQQFDCHVAEREVHRHLGMLHDERLDFADGALHLGSVIDMDMFGDLIRLLVDRDDVVQHMIDTLARLGVGRSAREA